MYRERAGDSHTNAETLRGLAPLSVLLALLGMSDVGEARRSVLPYEYRPRT